jgi:hypothetical protein
MKGRTASGAPVLVALIAGCCTALASCGLIVGVGDYAVGDSGADGTTGGGMDGTSGQESSAGDVGADRADAGGGVGGDATREAATLDAPADNVGERNGDAGAGGDATDGSDASGVDTGRADAEGGSPGGEAGPTCGQGLPTGQSNFQTLVSTCVHAISCDPFLFPISLSDCLTHDTLQATGSLACLSTKQDCAGYYQCQGARYATPAECPAGGLSSCDTINNLAIDCFNGAVTNCTQTGGTCQAFTDSSGNSRADCAVVNPCTVTDGGAQCSGNNYYNCVPSSPGASTGVGYGLNCTLAIATCTTTTGSGTACYFNGGSSCNDAGSVACNGSTLLVCGTTGQFNYDCSRGGGSCVTDNLGNADCVSPGCSLSTSCSESCDGAHTITACVGGAAYTIDCTQYGFTTCGSDLATGNVYCLP